METSTYLFTQIGFVLTTLVFYALALRELRKGLAATGFSDDRKKKIFVRTIVVLLAWMALVSILSLKGFFSDFATVPPKIAIILLLPLITMLIVTFSTTTREILLHIPAQNILRLQVFRVVVEILLWMLFIQNLAPVQMTFEGRNFDVLTGITAPFAAYLYTRKNLGKNGVILWNILGLVLLLNILAVAILSMPTPFRVFMNEPANTIVALFPIVWLPALLVPLAYSLHFLSLRQLSIKK